MADHDHEEKEQSPTAQVGNGAAAGESSVAPGADAQSEAPVDEMTALRTELAEAKDQILRGRAELDNYKKRAAREKADALRYGSERLLRELLTVIDNLERAADQLRTIHAEQGASDQSTALIEGIEMVQRGFVETLERHGVKVVDADGAPFDPAVHEAIGHVESPHPANTVIDEHQRGYALHDRLLRPALVTVGKGPAPNTGPSSAPGAAGESAARSERDGVEKPEDDG